MSSVHVRRESVVFPTYRPFAADKNPMFLEKRVYQGSTGKVYPLPFVDRISLEKEDVAWDAVHLENDFIRVTILPQLGGRIHVGQDKTNGYDFFYRQNAIKPALVGLAGPWVSGGVEFNWPQHHRPSTFMPADVHIEKHADGAVTVWLGEHEPMNRMKGMHGVCLHPEKAYIELKARVYNRTPSVQTFLWWANVATRVHEGYQSFFPPDVTHVADHAKRATSEFPLCRGRYYGVDYAARARNGVPAGERPAQFLPPHATQSKIQNSKSKIPSYRPDDLSWYANIPVPTSYMAMGSQEDFFGGYDHTREAGLVHIADHHIAPGKKQWTWGNHAFGYAWDRNLTDEDGPYIELMAGVYTDNQPDFSFLMPGETKTWSQYWYPIQKIGPAQHANLDAAVSLTVDRDRVRVGVSVSSAHAALRVTLEKNGRTLGEFVRDLAPGRPLLETVALPPKTEAADLSLRVQAGDREILRYSPRAPQKQEAPPPATEPPLPQNVTTNDELYLIGLHLEQYRHATRQPDDYWREALRRDAGDSRCQVALGRWHFRRGEFSAAESHFRAAVRRLTSRNPNPYDGEAHYSLGLVLRHLQRDAEAYAAFYKATWNYAWQAAGYHALAEIDCCRADWPKALDRLGRSLRVNADNLRARNLRALVLRRLGRAHEADTQLRSTLALDPLDWQARHLLGEPLACDTQVRLDLALDYARSGLFAEALDVLASAAPEAGSGTAPLLEYYRAWLTHAAGPSGASWPAAANRHLRAAAEASPDYCFPARLEEIAILEFACAANAADARAPYYLGNLLYDRRRHAEAVRHWERAAKLDPAFSVVWRNLGIAYFNVLGKPAKARAAYEKALRANRHDARVSFERDQLWKRLGEPPAKRLRELEKFPELATQRDDLAIELCALYNQTGAAAKALAMLTTRRFQPWEGGEGQALAQFVRTHLLLGRAALARGDAAEAIRMFEGALHPTENLGEARHLLANRSDIHFWLGEACAAAGDRRAARAHWEAAGTFKGDFQDMSVRAYSEMTYYSAISLERLGKKYEATRLLQDLLVYARSLARAEAKVDYFATSLPTMLLFEDDLQARQFTAALFLEAQARLGLGQRDRAQPLLAEVLRRDPNHALAADFAQQLPELAPKSS